MERIHRFRDPLFMKKELHLLLIFHTHLRETNLTLPPLALGVNSGGTMVLMHFGVAQFPKVINYSHAEGAND